MSGVRLDVLIATYASPGAARDDYAGLVALYHRGSLRETRAIVLLTADGDGRLHEHETGGGLVGKFVGHEMKRGFRGQLAPDSGVVVAIFDAHARPEVDRVLVAHVEKVYATAEGPDDDALEAAFALAELELAGRIGRS
jgi:hypothetical protein